MTIIFSPNARDIPAEVPPPRLELHEASAIRAAAHRALKAFPGPIGELVCQELLAHATFGWRTQQTGLMSRVARAAMTAPIPPGLP